MSEPSAIEDSLQSLRNIQMRTVWRKKEKEETSLLPYRTKFLHELAPVYAGIVKYNKCILADTHRQSVQKVCDSVSRHILCCAEPVISVFSVNHTENIEPDASFRWNIYILSTELPALRYITFLADVAFIFVVEVYQTGNRLSFEFSQLLVLIHIELRRGLTLGTSLYTSISRANADQNEESTNSRSNRKYLDASAQKP